MAKKITDPEVKETPEIQDEIQGATDPEVKETPEIQDEIQGATDPEVKETPEIQDEIQGATDPEVKETPVKASKEKRKTYSSPIYPNHKIGNDIKFVNGSYTAKNRTEEETIESDPLFGVKIFLLK
jgi:hypothetical protein